MKDDRNGNGIREERRSWLQRNTAILLFIFGVVVTLFGVSIKTWAKVESTTALAEKTDTRSLLDHDAITTIKSDVAYIKDEQSQQRALLNDIYRAVKK